MPTQNVIPLRRKRDNAELSSQLVSAEGKDISRRYATRYWFDARFREPARGSSGFPRSEDGSIEGAGRVIMKGYCAKVQCYDRVLGRVLWTLKRGPKVPGTRLFSVLPFRGDA